MPKGFWRETQAIDNRIALVGNSVINRVWYLFPQGGGPRGAFSTFADLKPNLRARDLVLLSGVLKEQVIAPVIYDVTILGAADDPRQATDGGVPTGGGASWLAPASPVATTPLIRVVAQGWSFVNLQMAPVAGAACITFDRRETAILPDSSHGSVEDCYFTTGGASGFGVEGIEVKRIRIEGCIFEALTGASGTAIKTTAGLGIAAPNHWTIKGNRFVQNINDINAASLNFSQIEGNRFFSTDPIETGIRIKLIGSTGRNQVILNYFSDVTADVTIAKGYTPAAGDVWANYTTGTAALIVTVPA